MRPVLVVDASAALAMLMTESGSLLVRRALRRARQSGEAVVVPPHFWLEVTNSLVRRHRVGPPLVVAAIHRLDEFGLETIDLGRPGVLLALDLAERHGLSAYDAAYLALAEAEDGRLLTADRRLTIAAGIRAVAVDGDEHRLSEEPFPYDRTPTWPRYREVSAFLAKLRVDAHHAGTAHRRAPQRSPRP